MAAKIENKSTEVRTIPFPSKFSEFSLEKNLRGIFSFLFLLSGAPEPEQHRAVRLRAEHDYQRDHAQEDDDDSRRIFGIVLITTVSHFDNPSL